MSGFYKILANKALDENLMRALKFRDFLSLWQEQSAWLSCHAALFSVYQILKLELENHGFKFSSLLRRVSKILKFALRCIHFIEIPANFKISW